MKTYDQFLTAKLQHGASHGFEPTYLPDFLFDFQRSLTEWAVKKGRGAIFADCGLGKTPMALVWAENVIRHTNGRVLILTPLAVGAQMLTESEKFDIEAHRSRDGAARPNITIANYEKLHLFDPADFSGVVCDESSILKSFDGIRRNMITEFMRTIPYRLLSTATAAPNDYVELGTSSEAIGYLGHVDMLTRFFKNTQNTVSQSRYHGTKSQWSFKPHAQQAFWRWVCHWARACRKPSDLGFDDDGFILPPLTQHETVVKASAPRQGMLFDVAAVNWREIRETRRRTIPERCEAAADKVNGSRESTVIWCHLNTEADTLVKLIPGAKQVSGSDSDDAKEEKLAAFKTGQIKVLVTKPKIGAWGLNWEHCSHVIYFPSFSYEQYYQAVRRCWRFGQTKEVVVDIVRSEGDANIMAALQRKSEAADKMFADLVMHMNDAMSIKVERLYNQELEVPSWL